MIELNCIERNGKNWTSRRVKHVGRWRFAGSFLILLALCSAYYPTSAIADGSSDPLQPYLDAVNEFPSDPTSHVNLARAYKKLLKYEESEDQYKAALNYSPANITYKVELGNLLFDAGKYEEARSCYEQVLSVQPSNGSVLLAVARCLESTNNLYAAAEAYQQISTKYPHSMASAYADKRLMYINKAQSAVSKNQYFPIDTDMGKAGFGWWDLKKMPIHVYIDSGSGVHGYRDNMRLMVAETLSEWQNASRGHISFVIDSNDSATESKWLQIAAPGPYIGSLLDNITKPIPDPISAQIHVHWIDSSSLAECLSYRLSKFLGVSRLSKLWDNKPILSKGHFWIVTDTASTGKLMSDDLSEQELNLSNIQLAETIKHEFGHLLGLPHTSNSSDIMFSNIFGNMGTHLLEARALSSGDVNSLTQHYNNFDNSEISASNIGVVNQAVVNQKVVPSGRNLSGSSHVNTTNMSAASSTNSEQIRSAPHAATSQSDFRVHAAMFEIQTKNYPKALTLLNQELFMSPKNVLAHYLRGVVLATTHDYDQAVKDYQEVVSLSTDKELSHRAQMGIDRINSENHSHPL